VVPTKLVLLIQGWYLPQVIPNFYRILDTRVDTRSTHEPSLYTRPILVVTKPLKLLRTSGVSVTLWPLPFTLKKYLKAKEELWKLEYFTMQKCNLPKKSSKQNQNPSRYYN
jgi:hypothetical protein